MKWCLLLLSFFYAIPAYSEKPMVVAIIDTGLSLTDRRFKPYLCKSGHWNFVTNTRNTEDLDGHGTHVTGSIIKYAESSNYCLVIVKYWSKDLTSKVSMDNMRKAISYVGQLRASIVNISSSGMSFDKEERDHIENASNTLFVVAAGNDRRNIDIYHTFPASYNLANVFPVGALTASGTISSFSNYGSTVKFWELGERVFSTLPGGSNGILSGTSMATSIKTGKLIKQRSK